MSLTLPARPSRRTRRTAIAISVVVVALAVGVVWLSVRVASDTVDAVAYDEAVALEGGVRPLVVDRVDELGTVTRVTVRRTPDPPPAVAYLLAPAGEQRARISLVSTTRPADLVIDGLLTDGRPYETFVDAGQYVSLDTVGLDGQLLEVQAREMSFDELLAVTAAIQVGHAGVAELPTGWVEIADTPMPPWGEGIGTSYDFLGGRRLGVTVERATAGREALTAYAHVEPFEAIVLEGIGDWAYRSLPPSSGVVFGMGDVVVDLRGDFSDPEFLIVASSLREMRPDEHPIADPDPSPF